MGVEKYGEETELITIRVPKSKKLQIKDKFNKILQNYIVLDKEEQNVVVKKQKHDPEKMNMLRNIALGNTLKVDAVSSLANKDKFDENYDCVYVETLYDIDSMVPVDSKGLCFYDKYDLGIFYVKWDSQFLKFSDKKQFDIFCKNNGIK